MTGQVRNGDTYLWEGEAGELEIPGHPGLHSETLSQKQRQQQKQNKNQNL
jgi:hypothetical protein